MNTSQLIEVRHDLHDADMEVRNLMQVSMLKAALANVANDNVDNVIATWGDDSDMVELAKEQMYAANRELVVANNAVKEAIGRYTTLAETLSAIHREVEAA